MPWTTKRQPFGANRAPLLVGLASDGSGVPIPVAVDPDTGELLVNGTGSTTSTLAVGQKTVNTTAVQVSSTDKTLTNGVLIKAPSTNADNIIVGLVGVTATTGDILEPGEVRGYAIKNLNLLYIISPSSTTDIISYSGN